MKMTKKRAEALRKQSLLEGNITIKKEKITTSSTDTGGDLQTVVRGNTPMEDIEEVAPQIPSLTQ